MKLKRHIPLMLASVCMLFSFSVYAQSSIHIKGAQSEKTISSGSINIKASNEEKSKPIEGLTVSNGSKDVVISNPSNPTNPSKPPENNGDTNNKPDVVIKTGYVNATLGLNVRSGPGSNYNILGALQYKTTVSIYENVNGWYKIQYRGTYGYVSSDYVTLGGTSEPEKPTTPTGRIKKIVVDPGHGGSDPGAIGPNGLREKDIVLNVSLKLKDLLKQKGIQVVMTRETDVYVSLEERVAISNRNNPDFFLSVHNNSYSSPTANGTETFSYTDTGMGAEVAKKIQEELVKSINLTNRGFKTASFYVLKYTNAKAALAELAFISNPNEENLLANDAFRTKCAKAMANAIVNY